jgi:hypothetical protein
MDHQTRFADESEMACPAPREMRMQTGPAPGGDQSKSTSQKFFQTARAADAEKWGKRPGFLGRKINFAPDEKMP